MLPLNVGSVKQLVKINGVHKWVSLGPECCLSHQLNIEDNACRQYFYTSEFSWEHAFSAYNYVR